MILRRGGQAVLLGCAVAIANRTVGASIRTTVDLAGDVDPSGKLGVPGIVVAVTGPEDSGAEALRSELVRALDSLIHTRPVRAGEPADYALAVRLAPRSAAGHLTTIPFYAALSAGDGHALWRTSGRTEIQDAEVDDAVLVSIARNVVAALMHDGWVQQRYDVDNPPPPPPSVRRDEPD